MIENTTLITRVRFVTQATAARRATSALQALERVCEADGAMATDEAPRARLDEMLTRGLVDEEQDLEPDEYDASSDDADDTAFCMQPAV